MRKLKAIELFAGVGGFHLGLEKGFQYETRTKEITVQISINTAEGIQFSAKAAELVIPRSPAYHMPTNTVTRL